MYHYVYTRVFFRLRCAHTVCARPCAQRLAGVSAADTGLAPLRSSSYNPRAHQISHRLCLLCPCRQHRGETIASHLCNLQTLRYLRYLCTDLCRDAWILNPFWLYHLGSSVAPRCVPQIAFFTSQHSFVLSACLPKPPCNLDHPSFCSACLNCPHAWLEALLLLLLLPFFTLPCVCFLFGRYQTSPDTVKGR